ncbi:hypothetical protein FKW77_007276 [Venturia effusa]|uniref:DNA mismatch repair proteins mutS family domain-containing protein n=1 Tax=Venturia effusa TaxID=50376 RepID=A0A517LFU1_9PEZI|nr:hypothetical protein FKW77_007276 [Venturia effusa]
MPPREYTSRGGRGRGSSAPSKSSASSRLRRDSTPRSASGAPSSRPSATPGLSRASAIPALVRLQSRVRIARSRSDNPALPENSDDGYSRERPLHEGEVDDDADSLNEVVLAVDLRERGTVGCAYYVARDEKLFFMEDARLGVKLHVEPTVILVSMRIDEEVMDRLDPELRHRASSVAESNDEFRLPYLLEVRPSGEFNYDSSKSKLANLRLDSDEGPRVTLTIPGDVIGADGYEIRDENSGRHEHLLRLAGWVDVESRVTVGCAGAVISYLQRRRATRYLPGDSLAHGFFRISALEMFSLNETMFVNADTLQSLQIIETESHPNSHNQGPRSSGSKEGLSVYGLFHHLARTPQGKYLLRQYFLRPSLNLGVINERLRSISMLLRPDNANQLDEISRNMRSVKNMRVMMISLRKGVSAGSQKAGFSKPVWSALRQFVFHALKIRDIATELNGSEDINVRNKVLEKFEGYHLAQVGRKISDIVDFEESELQHRTVVMRGVDAELDDLKHNYDGLDSILTEVGKNIEERVPATLHAQINIIYFPQIGFLISLRADTDAGSESLGSEPLESWERMFTTEECTYYKSSHMREMDQKYGDLWSMICDKEIEITHELAENILQYEELLTTVSDICGELDSMIALALGAKQYNLSRPSLTKDNIIRIEGGRHILQELTVGSYVANDTLLAGGQGFPIDVVPDSDNTTQDQEPNNATQQSAVIQDSREGPSMLIMTGPNYSGKSVYLKQVALIVYMSHIGCFVPADRARIGLTDKILTRISTRETVSRVQSAFMVDLQQVSLALNLATNRSLLVIDEFGKGTEADDGAGLACGILDHLVGLEDNCPKVLAATHFHEIFESGYLRPSPALAFGHMEVQVDVEAAELENQITYLYNFKAGRSISSFGTTCAAMNGVAPEIVGRAEEFIRLSVRGEDLVAACSAMPEAETMELEEAEQIARDFLASDISIKRPRQLLDDILTVSATAKLVSRSSVCS